MFDPTFSAAPALAPVEPEAALGLTEEVVKSGMVREKPVVDPSRAQLVKKWLVKIGKAKAHWKGDFERMKQDQEFVRGKQWTGDPESEMYVANVIQRHVSQRVAALYAKNPTIVVHRRKTIDFQVWDGTMEMLAPIQMAIQSGMGITPEMLPLIQDLQEGISRRQMLQKVSETLQVVYDYALNQQAPPFKVQMKQLVRRAITTGVGYVKLGFQRTFERDPSDVERINGLTESISVLERILADKQDDEIADESAELEQLRLQLKDYQEREQQIAHEGLVFDFPTSTSVIVDPACRHLRTFTGAQWIAEEHKLSVDTVKEIYGVDLSHAGVATSYEMDKDNLKQRIENVTNGGSEKKRDTDGVCVWTVWDKTTMQTLTVVDGYEDFLIEPQAPPVFLERFWPIFPLVFNDAEDEDSIFPASDVHLLKPMQREYNRSRQGLREHRWANRPLTIAAKGQLDEEDKAKLQSRPANAVVELNSLPPNGDVGKMLQAYKGPPIDGALYDVDPIYTDLLRVVGQSDASIGSAQAGVTATGDSIAEQNRTVSIASNVDDLDDTFNELSRAAGQVLLLELDAQTVAGIAGRGAVWPELSREEVARELMVEIEAGSSGRPNKAAEVANMERIVPLLLQIPGIRPDWLAKQLITRMDDRLDPTDAIAAGLSSIVTQNAMAKSAAAPAPSSDPNAQGGQGGDNAEKAPGGPGMGAPSAPPVAGPDSMIVGG